MGPENRPERDLIDFDSAKVLKPGRDPVANSVDATTAQAIREGRIQPDQVIQPTPDPVEAPEAAQPAPQPAQNPAVPTQTPVDQAPVQPTDSDRVQRRINRLFGERQEAREERDQYAQEIADLRAQVARLSGTAQVPQPSPQPTNDYFGAGQQQPQPAGAGDSLSRQELESLMARQTQYIQNLLTVRDAQASSRSEAEREFPDVFADASMRQTYEQVAPQFAQLPNGPYLAAALVRGVVDRGPTSEAGQVPPEARKAQLSGVGASVPQGTGNPPDALVNAFESAFARAAQTQTMDDWTRAMELKKQLLAAQGQ